MWQTTSGMVAIKRSSFKSKVIYTRVELVLVLSSALAVPVWCFKWEFCKMHILDHNYKNKATQRGPILRINFVDQELPPKFNAA